LYKKINFITHYKNDSIFSSKQFGHYSSGYTKFKKEYEKKGFLVLENAEITNNTIVIFRDLPAYDWYKKKISGNFYILNIWETPYKSSDFIEDNWKLFDMVVSGNDQIKNNKHRYLNYFIDDEHKHLSSYLPYESRKLAVAICSNRYDGILAPRKGDGIRGLPIIQDIVPGYKNRIRKVFFEKTKSLYGMRRKFLNKNTTIFDLYGKYWDRDNLQTWIRHFMKFMPNQYDSKGEWTGSKFELLSRYRFGFAFENFKNKSGYISEKIIECFMAPCVPIYSGCENIFDYIPSDCFIYVDTKCSPKELYYLISNINKTKWENYIESINSYINSDRYANQFTSNAFYDRLNRIIEEILKK